MSLLSASLKTSLERNFESVVNVLRSRVIETYSCKLLRTSTVPEMPVANERVETVGARRLSKRAGMANSILKFPPFSPFLSVPRVEQMPDAQMSPLSVSVDAAPSQVLSVYKGRLDIASETSGFTYGSTKFESNLVRDSLQSQSSMRELQVCLGSFLILWAKIDSQAAQNSEGDGPFSD
jgi:hypothetical protein